MYFEIYQNYIYIVYFVTMFPIYHTYPVIAFFLVHKILNKKNIKEIFMFWTEKEHLNRKKEKKKKNIKLLRILYFAKKMEMEASKRGQASKKQKKCRSIGTQVNARDLITTFEQLCEEAPSTFDKHNKAVFGRKKKKYTNIFIGGKVMKTSQGSLQQPIPYCFGPQTIRKNNRPLP